MAEIDQISQYFTGYFLSNSEPGKVFVGVLSAPTGAADAHLWDSISPAHMAENCSDEANRAPKAGLAAPSLGQALRGHFWARDGITSVNNQKEKSFVRVLVRGMTQ